MVNTLLLSSSGLEFMLVCLCNSTYKCCIGLLYRRPNSPTSIFEIVYLYLLRININLFPNYVLFIR